MKIHFLIPSTAEFGKQEVLDRIFGCNYGFFPQHHIFILSLATVLRDQGEEIEISDCVVEKISLDKALEGGGDIFVFYSVFLSRQTDLLAARRIKEKFGPRWIIFLGNDSVWFIDKYLMAENHLIIRGEPEETMLELVRELAKKEPNLAGIKSLSWREKSLPAGRQGEIIHNPARSYIKNLDRLPIPDRLLLKKPDDYPNARFSQFPSTTMLTSRGCHYRCLFCLPNSLSFARELEWKNIYRRKPPVAVRSAKKVIEEFRLIAQQGFRSVSIVDDQFLWGRSRTEAILEGIKDLNLEISILARCDRITDFKLARMLAQAGVRHIAFGVESFHQPILDYIRKDLKIATVKRAIAWCQKAGIEPEINIILGSCPLETRETMAKTIGEVEKLNVDIIHVNVMTPFPGTEFAKIAKVKGWMTVPEYTPVDSSAQSLIAYPHLAAKELVSAVKSFIFRHYFSPGYLWRNLRKIKSPKELWSKIRAGINEFRLLLIK